MSYAIAELRLGVPPVVIARLGNPNVTMWRGRCECGYPSRTYPLIGLVLEQMRIHAEHHQLRTQEAWAEVDAA